MAEVLKREDLLVGSNRQALEILNPFLGFDAREPEACVAFCDQYCRACDLWPTEERAGGCRDSRCNMRDPVEFRRQQTVVARLTRALADPELLGDQDLALLNAEMWEGGSAIPLWQRDANGILVTSYAIYTLRSALYAALHLYLIARVGQVFGHVRLWNAAQMRQAYASADRTLKQRQKVLVRRLWAEGGWTQTELAELVGYHRDTIAAWLAEEHTEG